MHNKPEKKYVVNITNNYYNIHFLLLCNKLPQMQQLKTTPICELTHL